MAVHESDIEGLPFTGGLFGAAGRSNAAVNGTHIVRVEWPAIGVSHLNLIDAANVHAAILALAHSDLNFQVKILKVSIGAQISIILVLALLLDRIVDQQIVLNTPTINRIWVGKTPAFEVLAIEQAHGFAKFDAL